MQGAIVGILCDVSGEAQVAALFKAALAHLGGLDVLVDNAGMPRRCETGLATPTFDMRLK